MNPDDKNSKADEKSPIGGVEFLDTTEAEIERELHAEKPEELLEIPKGDMVDGIEFDKVVALEEKPVVESITPDQKQNPLPAQKPNTGHNPSELHTYSEDIARAVKTGGGKILRQALTETDENVANIQKKNNQRLLISIATIILFVASIGIILYFAQPKEAPIYIESPTNNTTSVLSAENSYQIDVTDKGRLNVISEVVATYEKETGINTIANIYFIKQTPLGKNRLTSNEFLTLLQSTASAPLLAALDSQFMFGSYVGDETSPFLLLKSHSFESLSVGLRAWESGMLSNFHQLFEISKEGADNVFEKKFEDIVVANKDGRAVYNAEGDPVFMYIFVTDTVVVFSKDIPTVTEVVRRYLSPVL